MSLAVELTSSRLAFLLRLELSPRLPVLPIELARVRYSGLHQCSISGEDDRECDVVAGIRVAVILVLIVLLVLYSP